MSERSVEQLTEALCKPFDVREVKFKPAVVSGKRALALAYVDARTVQDRLDEVMGIAGWQDDYEFLPDGSVVCRLQLRFGDEWITKMDVGGQSEQPDEGDRRKAALSDALKRTAVKFGVGRYLYRLPQQWVDYDPQKKQFVQTPRLPSGQSAQDKAPAQPSQPAAPPKREPGLPKSGRELLQRLRDYDARLVKQGLCQAGELVREVASVGKAAGHGDNIESWRGPAIELAVETTRKFEASRRAPAA